MKKRIENLIKAAEYLGDSGTRALLEKWLGICESGKKPLPFVGRFSAGKSSLINSLLGTAALPTARMETTAALTRISYSAKPVAAVTFKDGTAQQINIDDVADLRHGNLEEKEENIAAIELGMPSPLLETGLDIVDTPGMDTIINNHVKLAQYIMAESVIVVYVISGAPTDFDMGAIRNLQGNGTGVIVVRTHMDAIGMKNEESFIDAVESDEKIFGKLPERVAYFPLSTLPEVTGASKEEFQRFEKYLSEQIAQKIKEVYDRRLTVRLEGIASRFTKELEQRKSLLQDSAEKSVEEIDSEIKALDEAIRKIEATIDSIQSRLSKEKASLKARILDDISDECEMAARRFKKTLNAMTATESGAHNNATKMDEVFQKALAEASEEAGTSVTRTLTDWANKTTHDITVDFTEVSESLKHINVEFDPDINMDRVSDIAEQQEALVDRMDFLTGQFEEYNSYSESRLAEIGTRKEQITQVLEELNATHSQALDAIKYLDNNYEPRYITKPSKMGELMRKVGLAGDIAMLAIPAIGWEKGATMLAGKAAILAGKTGILAQAGKIALTAGSNIAKIIATTDKTKDMITLVDMATKALGDKECAKAKDALVRVGNQMQGKDDGSLTAPPKKTSIFDYFSLSYWFGKFGEWVDPPRQEIDMEYEQRFREAHRACEEKAYSVARRRVEEERELGRIHNEAQAVEAERKFRQESLAREKTQCAAQLEKLARKKEEALHRAFVEVAIGQFRDAVRKIERHMGRHIDDIMDNIYLQILSASSQLAYSQLESTKEQLESMKASRKVAHSDALAPMSAIESIISMLK